MPEGDLGGRVGRDGGVDFRKRSACQERQRRKNQSKQLFHLGFLSLSLFSAPCGTVGNGFAQC